MQAGRVSSLVPVPCLRGTWAGESASLTKRAGPDPDAERWGVQGNSQPLPCSPTTLNSDQNKFTQPNTHISITLTPTTTPQLMESYLNLDGLEPSIADQSETDGMSFAEMFRLAQFILVVFSDTILVAAC